MTYDSVWWGTGIKFGVVWASSSSSVLSKVIPHTIVWKKLLGISLISFKLTTLYSSAPDIQNPNTLTSTTYYADFFNEKEMFVSEDSGLEHVWTCKRLKTDKRSWYWVEAKHIIGWPSNGEYWFWWSSPGQFRLTWVTLEFWGGHMAGLFILFG